MEIFSLPIINIIVFIFNGLWCCLCGRRLSRSFISSQNQLHRNLADFFYSLTVFFWLVVFSSSALFFDQEAIKISFNLAVLSIFIALAFFIKIPLTIKFPSLAQLAFWIILILGITSTFVDLYYASFPFNMIGGWIVWKRFLPLSTVFFVFSSLMSLVSTIFFSIGIFISESKKAKSLSFLLAVASFLLTISTGFWIAESYLFLNITYISAAFGYFLAYWAISKKYNI
jgi:hypothetical protein